MRAVTNMNQRPRDIEKPVQQIEVLNRYSHLESKSLNAILLGI